MIFILPFVFGAVGVAVGAVAGAFTAHAVGEKDRQAAKHHREVANELTDKFASLEKRYHEFADESKKQIDDLTRQNILNEIEKDCLRLAVRLQQNLISLMWEIDREPTGDALNRFQAAVEQTNQLLYELKEDLIIVPDDYCTRLLAPVDDIGIYKKLRNLLADRKWQEADNETANLIFKLSRQKYEMSSEYAKTVSATEFNIIDQLWSEYSNGRFGFSVQKQIWQEEYSKLGEFDSKKTYARFCEAVGWRVINGCLLSSYLNFSLNAPLGHLPVKVAGHGWSAEFFLCSIYKSDLGIYENLKNLLRDGKWREANEETRIIMLKVAGRSQEVSFLEEDIEKFSSQDLETIDQLWRTYSHDYFGFSVQNSIWQNVQRRWHGFGASVEWGYYDEWDNFQWISKEEITFDLSAPRGHLPAVFPCVTQTRGFSARLVWSVLSKFFAPEEVDFLKTLENIGIYQRLKRLLAAGKWREANHETRRVMLKLNGRIKQGDFRKGYGGLFCRYLYIIDKLWVIYSKGHFGFSVQENIWQEVHKDFQDFGTRVEWGFKRRKDYFWISHHKLNFSLDAPLGHLPAVFPLLNQYRGFDEQNVCYILSKFEFIPK